MVSSLKQLVDILDPRRADQRGAIRRGMNGVSCSAGRVVDLSLTGTRLQAPREWPAGESRLIVLTAGPLRLSLSATSVWSRREGWRKHIVGVTFDNLAPEQRGTLLRLVDTHAHRTQMGVAI